MRNRIEVFLEDMTYNTRFEFLEEGKNKDELMDIAEKRGIKLPSHDLSVFKGRYAYVDRMNLNKCTLPKEEVNAALDTLNGKAIDFDHYRKNVVGYWIDAEIKKNEIIAYGIFFKGNFQEDYETIQELMEKDVLAISFEAWGDREDVQEDGSYNLRGIEFAGGALLIKTQPAFPGSEVLEMAKKGKVLEMAKVLTPPTKFIHIGAPEKNIKSRGNVVFSASDEKINDQTDHFPINDLEQAEQALTRVNEFTTAPKWYNGALSEVVDTVNEKVKKDYPELEVSTKDLPEAARFYLYDIESILRLMSQVDCVNCNEKGFSDIDMIDFKNNKSKIKCINCDTEMAVNLTPTAKLSKKGRKITQIAKIDHDSAQATAGDNTDTVDLKTTKEEGQSMKTLLEKYKVDSVEKVLQEMAKTELKRDLTADELQLAYTLVEFKSSGGDANATSLLSLKGKSVANPVSLVAANVTEEDVKTILTLIEKAEKVDIVPEEKPAEETPAEKPAEEVPAKEEKPAEETPAEAPAEEKPAEAPATDEVAKLKAELTAKDAEMAKLKVKVEKIEKAEKEAAQKARVETITARKDELGEFGKDLSDEDILDESKYKIARQAKLIASLSAGKEVNEEDKDLIPELSKGSTDKEVNEEAESRNKIRELAFSDSDSSE